MVFVCDGVMMTTGREGEKTMFLLMTGFKLRMGETPFELVQSHYMWFPFNAWTGSV